MTGVPIRRENLCEDRENTVWLRRQRLEWCSRKPRSTKGWQPPPEGGQRQGGLRIPPRISEGAWPWWHLDFRLLASKSGTKKNFCSFKLPKLWYFVMAALENSYTISKKKSHMMIWIDTGKASDRKQHLFLIKTLSKLGIERTSST